MAGISWNRLKIINWMAMAGAVSALVTDPPELCWQVYHSFSSNRMLEQFPAVAAAVAAESFPTELCGTEIRWRTEQLSVGVTRMWSL